MQEQNNSNNGGSNLIIARGILKKEGKKPGQVLTRLFFDTESASNFLSQLQSAIESQEDGVSITVLEGAGQKGSFGMVSASGLAARQQSQGYTPQKKAYNPKPSTGGRYQPRQAKVGNR